MAKLKPEQIQEKVFKNSLNTCDYIDGYENMSSIIKVKCRKHNLIFSTNWENVRREQRAHHICPECIKEDRELRYVQDRVELECAFCHKKFLRSKSDLNKSKSGLYFCCKEHKDMAQRLNSGNDFDILRPQHYGTTLTNYRARAFREYIHKCAVCGWDEDEDILEVHHIDENHQNNDINNLIILCPICHRKITSHKYQLKDRASIIKI